MTTEEALTPQEVREIETEVLEGIATIGWFGRGFQMGLGAALAFALVAFVPALITVIVLVVVVR
jgi:hypothetical protein